MTISLCMIVKNEQEVLARCLESVLSLVDEMIMVDTGSTDGTMEIARRYTPHVYTFAWVNDFSAARNEALSHGTMDYLMWLDADDVVTPTSLKALTALKKGLTPDVSMVMLPYHVGFDEEDTPTFTFYRERLIRNGQGFFFEGAVHEVITPRGNVIYRDIPIEHRKLGPGDPHRNLRILEAHMAAGMKLNPRQQYYYARELRDNERYEEAARVFEDFLNSGQGWVENNIEACVALATCLMRLDRKQEALSAVFRGFSYGVPQPEGLCKAGEWFLTEKRYEEAIYWYKLALECPPKKAPGGFQQPEFRDYIPNMQLCVCYDRLGQPDIAQVYNDKAGAIRPGSRAYQLNKRYFDELKQK